MPGDAGDKTEAPTPRRMQEAREKGQVARSADLAAAVGLLAGMLLLHWYGQAVIKGFAQMMESGLVMDRVATDGVTALDQGWRFALRHAAVMLVPIFVFFVLIGVIVNIVQVGFIFTAQPITPNFDKISPIQGLARLFSRRTAIRLMMGLGKVVIIAVVAYISIKKDLPQLIGISQLDYLSAVAQASHMIFTLGLRLSIILLVLALIDYCFQKYQMWQDLRMTKEEVREELKRMEGDPTMRQRRRRVARQLASQRMSQAVPKADVVITNPTELAIALQYDNDSMHAPKVVAKGAGFFAQRIREIAVENNVPIVERKPLAQAIYKACEVGDFVPPQLYKAVAEVLAYVFELAGKGFRKSVAG
jgi:flagellar biosynthesis protein FlhB